MVRLRWMYRLLFVLVFVFSCETAISESAANNADAANAVNTAKGGNSAKGANSANDTNPASAENAGDAGNKASKENETNAGNMTPTSAPNLALGHKKAEVCAACHGADGNSPNPLWPNLAGQSERYLVKELKEYRKGDKGDRFEPIMFGMTQNLSDQDILDLAAYFASLKPKVGVAKAQLVALGEKIYRGGNPKTGVPACGPSCHGIQGDGITLAAIPRLGGQGAEYTADQLKKFRTGARKGDPNGIMRDIAKRMSDEEIQAVSSYVAGLH